MTTDRVRISDPEDTELQSQLEKVDWSRFLQYGSVKVQVRNGKPTVVAIEQTVKLD